MVVGIIGETGSGKSTLAKHLHVLLGGRILDGDRFGHLVLLHQDVKQQLVDHFSSRILTNDEIDRKALGTIVFNNSRELAFLNQVMHPLIRSMIIEEIHSNIEEPFIFIDGAALIEADIIGLCDCVLYVKIPMEERLRRLVNERGIETDRAKSMIQSQKDSKYYEKHATITVEINTCEREKVQSIADYLISCKEQL